MTLLNYKRELVKPHCIYRVYIGNSLVGLFFHRNSLGIILQDTCQVVVVGLELSLPLNALFFPLLNGQLMSREHRSIT